jgi:hypothetical protein
MWNSSYIPVWSLGGVFCKHANITFVTNSRVALDLYLKIILNSCYTVKRSIVFFPLYCLLIYSPGFCKSSSATTCTDDFLRLSVADYQDI